MGDHFVRRCQRDLAAPDRVAHAPLRTGPAVQRLGGAFCRGVVPLRTGAVAADTRVVSRAARRRGRADDSAVAVAAAVELSQATGWIGPGDVGDHDTGGAGGRAGSGW